MSLDSPQAREARLNTRNPAVIIFLMAPLSQSFPNISTIPASTSYPINFMIVHPSALVQVTKHVAPRIFSPEVNQEKDAWKFDYRIYHDIFCYENKAKGIYLSAAATANT